VGLRETLNRNPAITTGVTIAIIVIALVAILWQTVGNKRGGQGSTQQFFTTDNGATWFPDSKDNLPPYITKEGKEAVRIYLFKCSDGKPFVAYLERYTPAAKQILEQARAKAKTSPQDPMAMEAQYSIPVQNGTEVKKPLDSGPWHSQVRDYPEYSKVVAIKCPDGSIESLEPYVP
jgi:hypothetical protein